MPWKESTLMSQRLEFIRLAKTGVISMVQVCKRFEISTKTGYKWLNRFDLQGIAGLSDLSRKPKNSPEQTTIPIENLVLSIRQQHPAWGGRKIRARLIRLGHAAIPAPSTITAILHRHSKINPEESIKHKPWQRFEHAAPNQMWQMDFKGYFRLEQGTCHPLTAIDDHSRFSICLRSCPNEQSETVQSALTDTFRRYGLPNVMLMDNGSPWGGSGAAHPHTHLTAWLMRLGIQTFHGRPYHPQTQGKDERFHRTLNLELLRENSFRDHSHCQDHFNRFRDMYNFERPHEALAMKTPGDYYHPSSRAFPETLPPIEYDSSDIIRKVCQAGKISYRNQSIRISKAFAGYSIALRKSNEDGIFNVYFCQFRVAKLDLKEQTVKCS